MKKIITVKDRYKQDLDLNIAIENMDKHLLYEVYMNYRDTSPQNFFDQYCRLHKRKYRKEFDI